ncbi:YceH family protein [Thaumasiovibrio subtropicus]|uniref:YceH family protein n=1 Tax=Thaumasiovibrio subtropicus TaxID=1891207 RepID=UPI000B34E4CC|nr:DUF480 domain-containing protein [Thaumasiovibrio subtropicus]
MEISLNAIEARIIGCLLEKEITTPDLYPLTLNSLTSACNQKSNREPVMQLSEAEVMDGLSSLKTKRLVSDDEAFGGRAVKYKHRFCNTEFGSLKLTEQQLGIACVMLLRGAQTPGELRTRTNRLCQFSDVKETEQVLESLMQHSLGELVVRLPREAGKRESRYMHQFCGEVDVSNLAAVSAPATPTAASANDERIVALEAEVASLKSRLDALEEKLNAVL